MVVVSLPISGQQGHWRGRAKFCSQTSLQVRSKLWVAALRWFFENGASCQGRETCYLVSKFHKTSRRLSYTKNINFYLTKNLKSNMLSTPSNLPCGPSNLRMKCMSFLWQGSSDRLLCPLAVNRLSQWSLRGLLEWDAKWLDHWDVAARDVYGECQACRCRVPQGVSDEDKLLPQMKAAKEDSSRLVIISHLYYYWLAATFYSFLGSVTLWMVPLCRCAQTSCHQTYKLKVAVLFPFQAMCTLYIFTHFNAHVISFGVSNMEMSFFVLCL